MSEWRKMTEELPPVKEMVLLSWWGTIEGSSVGYRYVRYGKSYYCVDGDTCDGDDPEWWVPIPPIPQH
jgi:hypothetical protein